MARRSELVGQGDPAVESIDTEPGLSVSPTRSRRAMRQYPVILQKRLIDLDRMQFKN
jgi:hypothetical protein